MAGHTGMVMVRAFSPDGRFILSASYKTLWVWDTTSGQTLCTLEGHTGWVLACAFSPDGHFIVSASEDKTLRVWNAATGQPLRTLEGHTKEVIACAFSPDGRFIVSASKDKTLRVWDAITGEEVGELPFPGAVQSLGLHPQAPQMVCGDEGGAVYLLKLVGLEYGPIIVTSNEGEQGIEVRCPACQHRFQIEKDSVGNEISCSQPDCTTRLKVNPFVIQSS